MNKYLLLRCATTSRLPSFVDLMIEPNLNLKTCAQFKAEYRP